MHTFPPSAWFLLVALIVAVGGCSSSDGITETTGARAETAGLHWLENQSSADSTSTGTTSTACGSGG